jgi:GNAT superfamily N-acetyltransferase
MSRPRKARSPTITPILFRGMICLVEVDLVQALESALLQHWHHFGSGPGATWHEDPDLTWFEAPVAQLPYNGVLRTRLRDDADRRIGDMVAYFAQRQLQFMWVVTPTATPADLANRLAAAGVVLVERSPGMVLELDEWKPAGDEPAAGVQLVEVDDPAQLDDFETLAVDYWQLLPETRPFVFAAHRQIGLGPDAPGDRFIAYVDGEPAGKVYLSFLGEPGCAAIFAMSVPLRFRGRGLASALMDMAIAKAKGLGYERLVLISSEMAESLYRRVGFREVAPFHIHASTALH